MSDTYSPIPTTANQNALINSSAYRSHAWQSQADAWKMVGDLWCSPLYIRKQEQIYLDKFKRESPQKYQERLGNAVFTSKFRETIEQFAGTVFRSDPAPTGASTPVAELFSDIDGCGNSLHAFLLNSFEMYLRDGNGYFYIDAPPPPKEGQTPTKADRANDRPWVTFYSASQLINHRYENIGGRSILVRATIEKKEMIADGTYGEKKITKHLILTPGAWKTEKQNDQGEWVSDEDGKTGLPEIPLIPISEIGNTPPLLVLAMLNLLYYNKVSDFDSWCHTVFLPERYYQFDKEEDAKAFAKDYKELSPNAATIIFGQYAKAGFNEPTGKGSEIAHNRIKEIEEQMAALGIGMLSPEQSAQAVTATQTIDMAGRRQSKLARYAREFENAVEKAFYFLAEYINAIQGANTINLGEAEKASLKLKIDYSRLTLSLDQIKFFSDLVDDGKLSLETFYQIFQNLMELPDGFSPEQEAQRIAKERAANPTPPVVIPGQPIDQTGAPNA